MAARASELEKAARSIPRSGSWQRRLATSERKGTNANALFVENDNTAPLEDILKGYQVRE